MGVASSLRLEHHLPVVPAEFHLAAEEFSELGYVGAALMEKIDGQRRDALAGELAISVNDHGIGELDCLALHGKRRVLRG